MEREFDPAALGRRLSGEVEQQGWNVKQLQKELRLKLGETYPHTSYGQVWSYVNGHAPSQPRLEVVKAMAELLHVLPEYLMFGGPKTEEEERLRQEGQEREPDFFERLRLENPELRGLDYIVSVAFVTHVHRWVKAHLRAGFQVKEEEVVAYADSVWEHLNGPLKAWSRRIGREVPVDTLGASDYMVAALHALNFSLHLVAPAGVTHEDTESWPELTIEGEEA